MCFADLSLAVDRVGDPAAGPEDWQEIHLAKIARFQEGSQRIARRELRNHPLGLLIIFDQPEEQSAKRLLLASPMLALIKQRLNLLRDSFEFHVVFDDLRERPRKQCGILPAIQSSATSSLSSRTRGRIPRA